MPVALSPPSPAVTPSTPARRAVRWIGVPAALAAGLALWDPARTGGPPLCPYRALTGHSCPGCGLTRAIGALLRGRWDDAVALHPLAPVVVVLVVVLCAGQVLLGDRLRRWVQAPPGYAVAGVLSVAFLATWVLRVSTGQIDVLG